MDDLKSQGIKIIVSEFDGVMTDGTSATDTMGFTVMKNVYMPDFEAINSLKSMGYIFVFLSTDNMVTYNLLKSKNIPFFWAQADKPSVLGKILQRYEFTPDHLLYIGSKVSDYRCMTMAVASACPEGSISKTTQSTMIIPAKGGQGVISKLLSILQL